MYVKSGKITFFKLLNNLGIFNLKDLLFIIIAIFKLN